MQARAALVRKAAHRHFGHGVGLLLHGSGGHHLAIFERRME
jgi:hypothetical protein